MAGHFRPVEDRFWEKVRKTSGCWLWTARKNPWGYGELHVAGRSVVASRISWRIHFGDIADNLCVLHRGDNPVCVNPKHLFLGTRADNIQDCVSKNRHPIGSEKALAKLNEAKVRFIKKNSHLRRETLAKKFGVSHSVISNIIHNKRWTHV